MATPPAIGASLRPPFSKERSSGDDVSKEGQHATHSKRDERRRWEELCKAASAQLDPDLAVGAALLDGPWAGRGRRQVDSRRDDRGRRGPRRDHPAGGVSHGRLPGTPGPFDRGSRPALCHGSLAVGGWEARGDRQLRPALFPLASCGRTGARQGPRRSRPGRLDPHPLGPDHVGGSDLATARPVLVRRDRREDPAGDRRGGAASQPASRRDPDRSIWATIVARSRGSAR